MARFEGDDREQTSAPLSALAQAAYRRSNLPLVGKAMSGEGWDAQPRDPQAAVFDAMAMTTPLSMASRINLLRIPERPLPGPSELRAAAPVRLPGPSAAERMADLERVPRLPPGQAAAPSFQPPAFPSEGWWARTPEDLANVQTVQRTRGVLSDNAQRRYLGRSQK